MGTKVSQVFLITNIAILFLGIYFWIVYSAFRILMLYSFFCITLMWLTDHQQREAASISRMEFQSVAKWCRVSAVVLSALLFFVTLTGLYTRPPETSVVMAVILVLAVIALLSDRTDETFVGHPIFLLGILTFVVLYMSFSVYLVQPALMHGPAYATVDAYRDYANALRILTASRFESDKMILEAYYRLFPVLPLEIAAVSTVTGLPVNVAHLIIGAIYLVLGVTCAMLLSWIVAVGRHRDARLSVLAILPALVVLVNPQLIDPSSFVLTPLGFSVLLLLLVLYLALRSVNSDLRWSISASVSILLIALTMVPLHASSLVMMMVLFSAMALCLKASTQRRVLRGLTLTSLVCFLLYLNSYAGSPTGLFADISQYVTSEFLTIIKGGQAGASVLNVLAANTGLSHWNEVSSFLAAVPSAFFLAIASIMIVRLVEDRNSTREGFTTSSAESGSLYAKLGSFCLFCGLLFIVAYGGAYVLDTLASGVLPRYFVFPLAPIILLATTVILVLKLRDVNTARRLLLLGLLTFYIISVANSPSFLMESSPNGVRWVPTLSERAAASFLSDKLEIQAGGLITLILSDYPFRLHVQGILLSEHYYENNVSFPNLREGLPSRGHLIFVLVRQYFMQNQNLQTLNKSISGSYEKALRDSYWMRPGINRIFDDSSTCIYSGNA